MRRHTLEWTVDWGDCDPAGIVFYPRYFAWFDRAAHRLFEAADLDHHRVQREFGAIGLSLVDAQASFKRPATFGDVIRAEVAVSHLGRSSLTLSHRLTCGPHLLVEGREVRVWLVDDGGMKAAPLPAAVRAALETA